MVVSKDFNPKMYQDIYIIRNGLYNAIKNNACIFKGKMLDFGCGSKPYRYLFSNIVEYIGLDYHNEGHPHDCEEIDVYYDGITIPFNDNSFDCILSSEVFEHIFNINEVLDELSRVLKKDGVILITCPFVWNLHEIPNDYARYTPYALIDIFEKKGFEIIKNERIGNYITTLGQLKIIYFTNNILPKLGILNNIYIKAIIVLYYNIVINLKSRILPSKNDFYLSNLLIAKKM
jgi:ubiquinone/menaquinone biosynthesis C-methylase UbiE